MGCPVCCRHPRTFRPLQTPIPWTRVRSCRRTAQRACRWRFRFLRRSGCCGPYSGSLFVGQCCLNKALEQRVAVAGCRGEFRMELARHEPWVLRRLHHFNQFAVSGAAGDDQASLFQFRQEVVVDFVTVAMTFANGFLAVAGGDAGAVRQYAILGAKAHGATKVRGFGTRFGGRSEEHTSELQSRPHLVCRLLLEKKKKY